MPIQTNITSQTLPPWLEAIYRNLGERSEQLSQRDYQAYPYQRLEPLSEDTAIAHAMGRRTGSYEPSLQQAETYTAQGAQGFPLQYNAYMNPYLDSVVNRMGEDAGRTYREQIMPQLESAFVGAGQHGSMRHQEMAQRSARDLQSELLARQQAARASGFQQAGQLFGNDRDRALRAAEQSANTGRLRQAGRLADISALESQGAQQQALGQAGRDIGYSNFMNQQNFPQQQLGVHAATVHGLPNPMTKMAQRQTEGTPQTNTLGRIGNLAGQLYGMRTMMNRKSGGRVSNDLTMKKMYPNSSKKKKKLKGLGSLSLTQSSMMRQPKVGGKHSLRNKPLRSKLGE